jgi:hypothetical protein
MMKYALLALLLACKVSTAQSIPVTRAQSFGGTQVNLPSDLSGRIGVLVLGFSKKSSLETKGWGDSVLRDYGTDPHVVYYQMPVLADVPILVRGFILQGIRKQMSPAERMHFVPILQDAAGWKKVVQFAAPDDAYIVVLDSGGQIKWRTRGTLTGEAYSQLKRCMTDLQMSALSSPTACKIGL